MHRLSRHETTSRGGIILIPEPQNNLIRPRYVAAILLLAWLIALPLDRFVALHVHLAATDVFLKNHGRWLADLLKVPGNFGYAAAIIIALALLHRINWRSAGTCILAMIFSGVNVIFKWIIGRTRPYRIPGIGQPHAFTLHPFWHGLFGLFHEKNLSFPSGHSCAAAAFCVSLACARPRWWPVLLAAMLCTGAERILENAHYTSDVIAGYALGTLAAVVAVKSIRHWKSGATV